MMGVVGVAALIFNGTILWTSDRVPPSGQQDDLERFENMRYLHPQDIPCSPDFSAFQLETLLGLPGLHYP